jgi:hypothetical protein
VLSGARTQLHMCTSVYVASTSFPGLVAIILMPVLPSLPLAGRLKSQRRQSSFSAGCRQTIAPTSARRNQGGGV